jgi:hypothetical protein
VIAEFLESGEQAVVPGTPKQLPSRKCLAILTNSNERPISNVFHHATCVAFNASPAKKKIAPQPTKVSGHADSPQRTELIADSSKTR